MDKKRILIVDDEVGAARLLKANLEQTNRYEVRVENWPEDAAAAARQFKPDLLLLDILMPRMPGGDVVAAFEADPELRGIPIVFLTAAVRRHQVQENDGIICDHPCVAKPADVQEIIKAIEAHLEPHVRAGMPPAAADPAQPATPQV